MATRPGEAGLVGGGRRLEVRRGRDKVEAQGAEDLWRRATLLVQGLCEDSEVSQTLSKLLKSRIARLIGHVSRSYSAEWLVLRWDFPGVAGA